MLRHQAAPDSLVAAVVRFSQGSASCAVPFSCRAWTFVASKEGNAAVIVLASARAQDGQASPTNTQAQTTASRQESRSAGLTPGCRDPREWLCRGAGTLMLSVLRFDWT